MASARSNRLVCVGAVASAHGIRGALKLRCFTAAPENIGAYGPVVDERGRPLDLTIVRKVSGGVIATAAGIDTREAAEALRGTRLYVPRERLPAPTDPDEFYHEDLLGLEAVGLDGRVLGRVSGVFDFGAGDIIEIATGGGGTQAVPFTRETVPEIDLAGGRLVLVAPGEVVAADEKQGAAA